MYEGKGRSAGNSGSGDRVSGGAGRYYMLQQDAASGPEYRPAPGFRKDRTGNIRERTERLRLDGQETESGWYYLDPQTGRMMTGWIASMDAGTLYEHNSRWRGRTDAPRLVEGQCRKMVFLQHCIRDGTEGMTVTGWQWIDGKCYYFDSRRRKLWSDAQEGRTPDGYSVNADGQWVNENGD